MNNNKFKHFIVKIEKNKERFWVFPIEKINTFEYNCIVLNNLKKNKEIPIKSKIKVDLRNVIDTKLIE